MYCVFPCTCIECPVFQGIELQELGAMDPNSVDNALLNVAASQISTSMSKLNQDEVSDSSYHWQHDRLTLCNRPSVIDSKQVKL